MIEGKEPFDLAKAKTVLANFAAVHDKGKNLWPDNSKTGGDTASLPAIWENKADFEAKLAKLSADAKAQDAEREGPRQLQGGDGRGRQGLRRLPQHLSQEADIVIADHDPAVLTAGIKLQGGESHGRAALTLFGAQRVT